LNYAPFQVLRITEFRNFVLGRFVFIMGLRMMGTLVAWWMYELTKDPLNIGLIGLAEAIPAVGLALYGGYIVDKSDKRKLLLKAMMLFGLCALILLCASTNWFYLSFQNKAIVIIIYTVIFLTGAIRAFSGPAFGAVVASLVPRENLIAASQLSSTSYLVASITGHAIAGFFIAWFHVTGTFIIVCSLIFTSIAFIYRLKAKPPGITGEKKTLEAVTEGLKFVFKTKDVLAAISLDLFAVLFGGCSISAGICQPYFKSRAYRLRLAECCHRYWRHHYGGGVNHVAAKKETGH
jgi:MFS family permease